MSHFLASEAKDFIDLTVPHELEQPPIVIDLTEESVSDSSSPRGSYPNGGSGHLSRAVSRELERPITQDLLHSESDHTAPAEQAQGSISTRPGDSPAVHVESGPTSVHDTDVGITSQVGLNTMLAELGSNHGFQPDVVHDVYRESTNLTETEEILRAMQEAAKEEGSREIRRRSKKRKMGD
ncbi:hypothetical protein PAXINDRAFT_102926 [Paxillus involutus ATCC 200175]|uniref:Uncharacterized protein n=1 Tax=Paxillus involutus ATCC 200175 TaxID=664439 RepID=A0A0C9SX32_PAXIN|nr:hypothetical protein PAXINDRAFT_102926 [Paxillus involutus ATCC 200175]